MTHSMSFLTDFGCHYVNIEVDSELGFVGGVLKDLRSFVSMQLLTNSGCRTCTR